MDQKRLLIGFEIDPALNTQLQRFRKRYRVTTSWVMRQALAQYMAENARVLKIAPSEEQGETIHESTAA